MNVFSKIPVINKYAVKSCLKLDFNRCDNPYCNFKNPLQERAGRFTCAGRATNDVPSENKSLAKPRCIGTYVVTADQAALVLEARAKANKAEIDTTVKRAASKRAAAVARLKDKELKELQKDLERERAAKIKEQRTQEWIRLAKEHAKQSQQEEERGPAVPEKKLKREEHERIQLAKKQSQQEEERRPAVVQPEKELKRETRRLPIVIKTGPPAGTSLTSVDSDEDLTNAPSMTSASAPPAGTSLTSVDSDEDLTNAPSITSAPPLPTPRSILSQSDTTSPMRRRLRSEAAIPRPTCIMWAEPTPPQRGNSLPARRANYPPVSSKRNAKPRPAWVSHRNGVKITHYGELVPSTQLQEGP